ncbi:hypothetical protein K788_0003479 [Paraburkholderia caribensis MBA4]|uniref:Uncharacterized protein n=1 Tax=Paraburkholderia caribensis MBA4 TaxID=1323664 RepID=A0A0N7JTF0_9BURK|nr:hypothetical protein K788_0003479 [Paraburkholderia caribensis MBA4]
MMSGARGGPLPCETGGARCAQMEKLETAQDTARKTEGQYAFCEARRPACRASRDA